MIRRKEAVIDITTEFLTEVFSSVAKQGSRTDQPTERRREQ